jgi:hypothetical protein
MFAICSTLAPATISIMRLQLDNERPNTCALCKPITRDTGVPDPSGCSALLMGSEGMSQVWQSGKARGPYHACNQPWACVAICVEVIVSVSMFIKHHR